MSSIDLLKTEQEMTKALEKVKSVCEKSNFHTAIFVAEEIHLDTISHMLGDIEVLKMKEIRSFHSISKPISIIEPTENDHAWVREQHRSSPRLLNHKGDEVNRMTASCTDLAIIRNGDVALVQYGEQVIKIVNSNEEEVASIDTKHLYPEFISATVDGDMLVSLRDDGNIYNILPTSRRIVERITHTGKVLHTYEFRMDGITRLFTWPTRTAENKNTDVCIINRISKTTGELIVLLKDGRMKFTYSGKAISSFCPTDVKCDENCRILVTEINSHSIQFLSRTGKFITSIAMRESPSIISLYRDRLWLGYLNGMLKVYSYK